MLPGDVANESPMLVILHPRERHIGGGLHLHIQPDGQMRDSCPLDLVQGGTVPWAQRKIHCLDLSFWQGVILCDRMHQEPFLRVGHNQDTGATPLQDDTAHAIDKRMFLVFIFGDGNLHALIEGHLVRLGPILRALPEVVRVAFRLAVQDIQALGFLKERLHGQGVEVVSAALKSPWLRFATRASPKW